jgi:diguanylate cyclase (GGDEF)-like protein
MPTAESRRAACRRRAARGRVLLGALGVGLAYAGLAKLIVVVTAFAETAGATFWPGAGLTVAVLLLRPRSEWRYHLTAVAIAEIAVDATAGYSVSVAVGWAVANTAEPLVAAWLLTRRGPWPRDLVTRSDLVRFVLAAFVAGPLAGAAIGTLVGAVVAGDAWLPRLPRWFVGDAIGVLVVAPALLALRRPASWRPTGRAIAWSSGLVLTSLVALGPWEFAGDAGLPFLTVPMLIVIAVLFGTRGAAGGVLVVAIVVEAVTADGRGAFADDGTFHGVVIAQMFVAMSAVTAHTVAALTSELVTRDELEGRLRALALRDSLTGLANRRLLFERLDLASRRLTRHRGVLALLFIDLDGFKAINDNFGHAAGDGVLVDAAQRLRAAVREQDTIARLGGDEFMILAEDLTTAADAGALAERVVAAFEEPFAVAGQRVHVTASIGIAARSEPVVDADAYLSRADQAMYVAKRRGGSRFAYAPDTGLPIVPKSAVVADLPRT